MNNKLGKEFIDVCRELLMKEYLSKIEKCVGILHEDDLWWRGHETDNGIGNLILHLSGNVRQWIISGIGGAKDMRERQKEFDERRQIPKAQLLEKLRETLREADKVLAAFDAGKLLEVKHVQKYDVTCLYAILHVVEHFAGHVGQIIYVTKMRRGIDLRFYDL